MVDIFHKLAQREQENLEKIGNADEKDLSLSDLSSALTTHFSGEVGPKLKVTDYLKSSVSWVYACVEAIAAEVANVEIKLMKIKADDDVEEVRESDILDFLHRVNSVYTKYDFFYLIENYIKLAGEAPIFLQFKGGKPYQAMLLRPDRLTILPGKKDEIIGGYKYQVYGTGGYQEIKLEAFEVILLKRPDPNDPLRGKSILAAMAKTYDLDEYSEDYNRKFFANAGVISAVLSTDKKLSKTMHSSLESKLRSKHAGYSNAHKWMVLEQGLKFEPMQISQKEMDFIESMKFTRDKILALFRVPKSILGITEDVNRANAEASNLVFAMRVVKPELTMIFEQLNEFLVPLFDRTAKVYLDFTDPVPENREQLVKEAQAGVQTGYMTLNEARQTLGLDPIEGGDVLAPQAPSLDQALTEMFKGIKTGIKSKALNRSSMYRSALRRYRQRKKEIEQQKEFENMVVKELQPLIFQKLKMKEARSKMKALKQKVKDSSPLFKKGVSDEGREKVRETFHMVTNRIGAQHIPKYARVVNTYFRVQQGKVLKKLEAQKDFKALKPEQFMLDIKEEAGEFRTRLTPITGQVIKEQSHQAFSLVLIDDELTPRDQVVKEFLSKRLFQIGGGITKQTNEQLASTLEEGIRDGESITALAKRVKDLFTGFTKARTEVIARTEVSKASNFAHEASYKESGVVDAKEWYATLDERTGDLDAALHGTIIELGRNFSVQGVSVDTPPLHPNCRCVLLPVIL